jgi:UDP-2-acetamido-3-amino-2,3-dideoxy-glucuronate N-acetyltransferase
MQPIDIGAWKHPSSIIDEGATIGQGTKIWHFCHISSGARVGENCVLGQNVYVGPGVKIGDGCKIQNNVSVYEGVTLEDNVFCGPSCVFTNVKRPVANVKANGYEKTLVKSGAVIGANATIVCGVTLGEGCFIGAGAVVTHDVKEGETVYGVPARSVS